MLLRVLYLARDRDGVDQRVENSRADGRRLEG